MSESKENANNSTNSFSLLQMDKFVIKRNGMKVKFDENTIVHAIMNAFRKMNEGSDASAKIITKEIYEKLSKDTPLEHIQDLVEQKLMEHKFFNSAKEYILYRNDRHKLRDKIANRELTELVQKNSQYFETDPLREFVYYRTYSRWIENKNRREVWSETVGRYMNFMKENLNDKLTQEEYLEIETAILKQEVMASMRLLQFAGDAARRCNVCAYNCAYTVPTSLRNIVEICYASMCGTGVGWSVENKYVDQLPIIKMQKVPKIINKHTVDDSKEGWCNALLFSLEKLYDGEDIELDYSHLRLAGSRLKITGGRSSGPDVLKYLIEFIRKTILNNQGGKLTTLKVYDIICKIGEVVVAGGVRRCLKWNSLVLIENGSTKQIKDIDVGDRVLTNDGWKPVTAKFDQGEQELLEIHHQNGSLYCTPNHRLAVMTDNNGNFEWKEAKFLDLTDKLAFPVLSEEKITIQGYHLNHVKMIEGKYQTYDIEVQDNHCFVCEGILVHNSAMISLSDLNDTTIRDAKIGAFWEQNAHRAMANNSAVYSGKLSMIEFMDEWIALAKSGTGERGIFNRGGLSKVLPKRRLEILGEKCDDLGGNPCLEIFLKPQQFCNLTEVICRSTDTLETLKQKIKIATILGTYQSTLTNFKFLSDKWKENQELERLLGVSLTGQWDCEVVREATTLEELKMFSIEINKLYAERFGINQSTAITCTKPSGCSKKDTLLITNRGILTLGEIGNIKGEKWQDHNIDITTHTGIENSTKFYVNGTAQTKKILMKSGLVLESTLNHQYMIFDIQLKQLVWKKVEELKIGDMLPYSIGDYKKCNVTAEVPLLTCLSDKIKQPTTLTADLAWLLGIYGKDGSNHKKGIRIASNSNDLERLQKAKRIAYEQFGIEGIIYQQKEKNNTNLYLPSTYLLTWLNENSLLKNNCIPIQIRKSPIYIIKQFIDGYSKELNIETKSYKMAEEITIMLRAIGQNACMSFETHDKQYSINYKDEVSRLETANLSHLTPDYIIELENSECETFDIEVPNGNQYLANTYISHNTVSQLVNSSSGIHPRFSPYYIRRVRISATDPLFKMLRDQGIPYSPEVGQQHETATVFVFEFPVKSPDNARCVNDVSAIEQLEYWKKVKHMYCEHNPSVTIYVKEDEWLEVGNWVYKNFSYIVGISFLPYTEHVYQLAPYEAITAEKYQELLSKFPQIHYEKLIYYEIEDSTDVKKELACAGGVCEL